MHRAGTPRLVFVSSVAAAVAVVDLRVTYGSVKAVDGLTMTAPAGAITAVVGRNGQGKTTTIEVCEGLRRATGGSVRVLGLDPQGDAASLRPRVGVMLQDGGIGAMARPADYLRTLAAMYANPRDPAELLGWLGLAERSRSAFRRLSGGEQQRVKLAAALIGRPELVFLDEPSTGLDPAARRGMWELLGALRRDGVSVVLTTHQMVEAETLADHIVVVEAGRAIASGTLNDLVGGSEDILTFNGPMHLDLRTLTSVVPVDTVISEPSPGRYRVAGRVTPQTIASVTAWCAQHGVTPRELHVGRRSLEDLFLDLADDEDHVR
ncbi:MAG: type transport system ATP-binding protein [Actinomycetota bacterium]|nr:type transport system ATP-binding protein [Actinomycetota bacterium]